MSSLYNKFLDFIGIEETDDMEDEGYYRDEPEIAMTVAATGTGIVTATGIATTL